MENERVQEVAAETIDPPEIVPESLLDREVARATEKAATWPERYMPRVPKDAEDAKQARRERTALRKEIAEVNDRKKSLVGPVRDAVRRAEARFADVTADGRAMDAAYKRGLDEYDRQVIDYRLSNLAAAYAEYAPDLAELVPFERVDARWGEGDGWHKTSSQEMDMRRQMEGHASEMARCLRTIDNGAEPQEDKDRWRDEYLRTLDFTASAQIAQEARERRERMRQMRDEREAWEREQSAQAEPYVPEESYVPTEAESAPQTPDDAAGDGCAGGDGESRETAPHGQTEEYRYLIVQVPASRFGDAVAALKSIPGSHGKVARTEWWYE